jgi:hypothetical protein
MISRFLGVAAGVSLILIVLLLRGLPVIFFLKMIPLLFLIILGLALIYAGLSSD